MESDQTSIHASSSSLQRNRPLHGRTGGPTRRSSKGQWTTEEDEILRMAVQRHKGKNWKRIAQCFKDRTDVQCLHRWQKVINPDLVKGPWSKKEDETIIEMVNKYGPKKWSTIAQHLPGRIGKQCRERWHNHLNPNINKEAWTQDEELMLIRAHQMYGNKWAELTRFLPGRTDNAIKNHWNSSVKKKVNMYFASGLLSHFPGMPPAGYQNPSAASSSSQAHQFSEGDNIVKGGSEVEEASLSGKSRTIATEDCCETEGSSSNPFPEDYCPTFQDATCSMSDVPHEQGDKFLEDNSSLGWGTFGGKGWQQNLNMQPDISLPDLGQETSGMFWSSFGFQESHQAVPIPQESSITLVALGADNVNLITGPDGRLLYLVANPAEYCPSENVAHDHMDYLSLPFEIPEGGTFDAQCYSMPSEMLGDSFSQPVSGAGQLPQPDGLLVFSPKPNPYSNLQENADPEPVPECINDNVVISKESDCSRCEDYDSIEVQDLPKLVPANDFVSAPFNNPQSSSKEKDFEIDESKESEPVSLLKGCPRFPSLDIPAFSSDWQEDYSPLGIRKLMISTIAPFKPWDSPSRVKSPGSALKTAKTFTGSILRKRHRDLVSPLSEIRGEKKVEVGLEEGFFSNLANDFSRLEVMFDECVDKKEGPPQSSSANQKYAEGYFMDKENVNPACGQTEKLGHESTTISEINMSQKEELNGNKLSSPPTEATAVKINGIANGAYDTVKEFSGGLVEHDMNDMLFFSPGRFGGIKIDQAVNLSTKSFAIHHGALLSSSESCLSVLCSPRLSTKKDGANMVITTTSLPSPSNVENPGKSVATENNNNNIFMESPLQRSIESPSTWKSPWFINTFAVDTDITIEDIGYFLSPGDQSYDAIGLMKQLGDQTIERFTDDTQEVLGGETQQSVMQENNGNPCFHRTQHQTATTTLARERRTLDFSECGTTAATPEKGSEMVFSAPTSFLLKRCR